MISAKKGLSECITIKMKGVGKMKKSIKLLSIIMISIFFLFSVLPIFAEETFVSESARAGSERNGDILTDSKNMINMANASESTSALSESSTVNENTSGSAVDINALTEGKNENIFADSEDTTSDSDIRESTTESALEYDTGLLDVVLPVTVSMTIDPYEINGRGQIFSDTYKFENLGNTDVKLTFTDMKVTFPNEKDFEALAQPFDIESKSDLKAIYMVMNFGRDDIPPVVLTDEEREGQISIPMPSSKTDTDDNSFFSISFSGNLNENPALCWRNGDVKINIQYNIETIPTDKASGDVLASETTPAGAVFELDQSEYTSQGTDSTDEAFGGIPASETTPAGAVFELDRTESSSREVGSTDESSGDITLLESSPVGSTLELDQSEYTSQGTGTSDEAFGDVPESETTPVGAAFELDQAEFSQQGTGLSDEMSGDVPASNTTSARTVFELDQVESASQGMDSSDEAFWCLEAHPGLNHSCKMELCGVLAWY
jgi:hypothetical protein